MSKQITEEHIAAFREECNRLSQNGGTFSASCCDLTMEENDDGEPLWEYEDNEDREFETYNIYDLFEAVENEFEIEEDSWDSFFVTRKPGQGKTIHLSQNFNGQNTSAKGTLTIDETEHTIDCTGNPDQGTTLIVDGVTHEWLDEKQSKIREAITDLFDKALEYIDNRGFDTTLDWDIDWDGKGFLNMTVKEEDE